MKYTINELANSKGVSQLVREALLQMEAELDATNRQVEILSDALAESRREVAALKAVQEPVGCEGAIVNGRVYADRLEHDYKFECEAGPLHLCNDWVEFRRCFEWLATHTTPPAAQRPDVDALVALARADEREACAMVCTEIGGMGDGYDCAAAIRARGNT
jgi:uncharacterized protein YfcZ (UPF0381/DUF406 family)